MHLITFFSPSWLVLWHLNEVGVRACVHFALCFLVLQFLLLSICWVQSSKSFRVIRGTIEIVARDLLICVTLHANWGLFRFENTANSCIIRWSKVVVPDHDWLKTNKFMFSVHRRARKGGTSPVATLSRLKTMPFSHVIRLWIRFIWRNPGTWRNCDKLRGGD